MNCLPIIVDDLKRLCIVILQIIAFCIGAYVIIWWVLGAPFRAIDYIYDSGWWFVIWPVYALSIWAATIHERCKSNPETKETAK